MIVCLFDFSRYIEADITPQQILGGNKVITAPERLAVTLRFLATGETYRSLSFQFRISRAAISYIIKEVCSAIAKHLGPHFLRVPSSSEEWLAIANAFQQKWQYPNCIGAIDGKHIVMQPPPNAGSYFYNYKHSHSVVLMAVAGPDYQCLYADVGTNGRISDGGVWNKCGLAGAIEDDSLSIPPPKLLPNGTEPLPFVLVGDDAFALKPYLMKPYPQHGLDIQKRIYNYRHSRARRISENLFGILANRWRVFKTIMQIPPETIEEVVMAALTLHNFLRSSISKDVYFPAGLIDSESEDGKLVPGLWRQDSASESFLSLQVPSTGHNATTEAKRVREGYSDYFVNEGAIEWQWERCS